MKLLFLHGPPACGKYTIGRELAALADCELYHNHLVVDEVLRSHAFGSPGFVTERDRRWREFLGAAAQQSDRRVIFTFNPENSVPQTFIDWLFDDLVRAGAVLHSVALTLTEAGIEDRLGSAQRQRFKKLTDLALYRRVRAAGGFATPVIPRTDLSLDTETQSPAELARQIVRHFRLA